MTHQNPDANTDPELDPQLDPQLDPIEPADDFDLLDDRPGWPKPVAIISIVFAALALTCGVIGTGFTFASDTIMTQVMGGQLGDAPPPPQAPPADAVFLASVVLSFGLNILLVTAGIGLLRRRYAVRKLFLIYAVLGLLATGFSVYAQLHGQLETQKAMETWIEQHGETNDMTKGIAASWEQQQQSAGTMTLVGIAVGILIGAAWPVFCGIWFGAVKAKEHTWTGQPAADSD